jgi:hypothetical protein
MSLFDCPSEGISEENYVFLDSQSEGVFQENYMSLFDRPSEGVFQENYMSPANGTWEKKRKL